jgi:hypothetical protein
MEERQEEVYDRLSALAPACGSCFEPLARGFEESTFREELQQFIASQAPKFLVVCEDGSHPLEWTVVHAEYKDLFERQLAQILARLELTEQDLVDFCSWLKLENKSQNGFLDDDGLQNFLEAVTACEDYDDFLKTIFAEVGRQAGEEIDVAVPDGASPGDPFAVEYLGVRYDLCAPEVCEPGTVMRVAVVRPPSLSSSLFQLPDSFYGLD